MKGIGTDEQRIIRDLTSITNQERQAVKERYQAMYGNTLEQDLKDELKGDFEDIVIALLKPRYDFEAECIRKAIKVFLFEEFSSFNLNYSIKIYILGFRNS